MAIIVSADSSTPRQNVSAGSHIARCYSIVDAGTHDDMYQGKPRLRRTVRISWEIPGETFEKDGKLLPLSIHKPYSFSLSEKATLRKDLESWRGRPFSADELKAFDLAKLLGQPAMLSVLHVQKDGKTYAQISSVSKPPKGLECPPQVNPSFEYSVMSHDQSAFDKLPDFMKDTIRKSKEYLESLKAAACPDVAAPAGEVDEVPF